MSADLDWLIAKRQGSYVGFDTIRRIAADYARLEAERDEARAMRDRLGETVTRLLAPPYADLPGDAVDALDAWQAAKEAIAHTKVEPLSPDPNWHYDQDQMNDLERDD